MLFNNIFVALCGVAQVLVTYSFLGIKPASPVCLFLFFATLVVYNFSFLNIKTPKVLNTQTKRDSLFYKYYNFNLNFTVLAFLALIPLFLGFNFGTKILVIFLGILSLSYFLPVIYIGNKWCNLRSINGLKLFFIALVWVLGVVLLPVYQIGKYIPSSEIVILILKQFLLFAAITIPFDVRDFYHDKASNLKTLPIIFGLKKAYIIAVILLFVNLLLVFSFTTHFYNANFIAAILTPIVAIWVILTPKLRKSNYHYLLHLDGILILQYFFLILFKMIL